MKDAFFRLFTEIVASTATANALSIWFRSPFAMQYCIGYPHTQTT